MFELLNEIEKKYEALSRAVNDPAVIAEQNEWRSLVKEQSELMPVIEAYSDYKRELAGFEETSLLYTQTTDEELRQLAKDEIRDGQEKIDSIVGRLRQLLLPKDPNDDRNVIVEIRGGAGGNEAALFAGVLFRMYARYAERSRWKTELMDASENSIGGYKEIIFMITGKGAFSRLKYESGVHRVQRVPVTESIGRIHTSTVTVAVLPEADEVDAAIDQNDLRIDVYRSSGHGGQSVNTTDSAVRVTHLPTGLVVSCQDEKSQLKNKEKALKVLRSKLYAIEQEKQHALVSAERKSQVGTGDRSERIRTYNYPQGRVTDHRVQLNLYKLDEILDGDINEIIDGLTAFDQSTRLGTA